MRVGAEAGVVGIEAVVELEDGEERYAGLGKRGSSGKGDEEGSEGAERKETRRWEIRSCCIDARASGERAGGEDFLRLREESRRAAYRGGGEASSAVDVSVS